MDNLVIISNYDSGYGFSAMIDGKLLEGNSPELHDLRYEYNSKYTTLFVKWCFDKYHKDVLICDNGDIEYFQYDYIPFRSCQHFEVCEQTGYCTYYSKNLDLHSYSEECLKCVSYIPDFFNEKSEDTE